MSPEFSNIESWEIINKFYARVFGIYVVCANRVGKEWINTWENNTSETVEESFSYDTSDNPAPKRCEYQFWGGSEIINPYGKEIYKAAYHKPDEIVGVLERDVLRKKKILLPYLRNDDPYFTHRELSRILFKSM